MAATITSSRLLTAFQNSPYQLEKILSWSSKCTGRYSSTLAKTPSNKEDDFPVDRKLDFVAESLAARGYLRNQKSYTPPRDVDRKVLQTWEKHMGKQTSFVDATMKFKVLAECSQKLHHFVPNNLLHKITNIEELLMFYKTPIDTAIPLDMMKNMDLPKNLHVIYKYHRFHPETDTKFGGNTVFTRDSTIVTGLKYKNKYPDYKNTSVWPYK